MIGSLRGKLTFKRAPAVIIECSGVGVTGSDYSQFKFEKVRRPIFPLDL